MTAGRPLPPPPGPPLRLVRGQEEGCDGGGPGSDASIRGHLRRARRPAEASPPPLHPLARVSLPGSPRGAAQLPSLPAVRTWRKTKRKRRRRRGKWEGEEERGGDHQPWVARYQNHMPPNVLSSKPAAAASHSSDNLPHQG